MYSTEGGSYWCSTSFDYQRSFSPISSKVEITSSILSLTTKDALLSALPVNLASWKNRNIPQIKMLNKMGTKIEFCGTPEMIHFHEINLELTFGLFQRFDKWSLRSFRDDKSLL